MNFNDYQKKAISTDAFKGKRGPITSPGFLAQILGLSGETGELADKFKKIIRDKNSQLGSEDRDAIIKELGDVLWYVSGLAYYLDVPLQEVADRNIGKLSSRKERNTLKGSGDNR